MATPNNGLSLHEKRPRAFPYFNRPLPPLPTSVNPAKHRQNSWKPHFPTSPPTLLPTEKVDTISLQDYTFLYILSHIDQYPVETLALLPKHWRRCLLSALPPFRLYQLENTVLAKDIDTVEMWTKLSQLKDSVWSSYLMKKNREGQIEGSGTTRNWEGSSDSLRMRFINYLSYLLFNAMNRDYTCKRITELLHATHIDLLDKSLANGLIYGHINSLFMFQPPYYLIPFRCPNMRERELYWSLYSNRMFPTSLELYTSNLDSSPLWNQEFVSQEMMSRLLHKINFLCLYNRAYSTEQLEKIINAVTHSNKYKEPPSEMGSLKYLEILRATDKHLSTIAPFFSGPHGYSTLISIIISMRSLQYFQASSFLSSFLKNQLNTLQHLELKNFTCSIARNTIKVGDYMLFMNLAAFILKPQFRSLTLNNFRNIPWKLLQMVVESNLRTVPSHNQTIIIQDSTVTTKGEMPFTEIEESDNEDENEEEKENQFCPAWDRKCLRHKRIHFQDAIIPIDVFNFFERTERLCVNTLEFNQINVDVSTSISYEDHIEYMTKLNGVCYGYHVLKPIKLTEAKLKSKFLEHDNFERHVFIWNNVRLFNINK